MKDDRSWTYREKISIVNVNMGIEERVFEELVFESEGAAHAIASVPAHIFKFTVRSRRAAMPIKVIGSAQPEEFAVGHPSITGIISLVTTKPCIVDSPFDMYIYSKNKHVATIYDIMFTCFKQEYNLIDRYIFEGAYAARSIELIKILEDT
jgi:hypothetical protein